jgi:predicted CXXCH cytochrome family protein
MNSIPRKRRKPFSRSQRWLALGGSLAALSLGVISCRSVNRSVVLLPHVPGANYIGSKECVTCHDEIYRDFKTSDHARLIAEGKNALEAGCESCHGPGSIHSDSGGETKPPYSFTSGRPDSAGASARPARVNARAVENVCYNCHADVRGQFNLPSHHPVPEGKMTCTECHPPHKGIAHKGGSTALMAKEENCLQCHPAQRGPYVFEHEASREGCSTCHTAHGSVNDKMLTQRDSTLCLKCHFQQASGGQIIIGGSVHTTRVQQGTCWTAGCHEAVHGSRVNSSLRY